MLYFINYWVISGLFFIADYFVDVYDLYHYKISKEKINWKQYKEIGKSVIKKQLGIILPIAITMDKMEYNATIIGRDPKTDIAVLQINAKGLTDLDFGDSDKLRVGEWVIAVGSPFSANLSHTVTAGIVSAKGRGNIIQGDVYEDFIQTDAAINPGNSGGALLNSSGDLIGINTAIFTNGFDRSNKGVGFAIPSNMIKRVMSDLIDHGKVLRSWIGVQIQPIDDTAARALDVKTRSGALVADVVNKGPAEKAGVETGDVIVEFNNLKINSVDHLRNTVSSSKPNRSYDLVVIRDGRKKRLKVILEEMPGDDVVVSSKLISKFTCREHDLSYYIALEPDSSYEE